MLESSAWMLPHHSHALHNLQSEEELKDAPNQQLPHHQQEAQPAKRAKRADGGTVVASITVPFPDTSALRGATALQRQLIVADFVAAALQAMAAEAGHPASSPSLAGGSTGLLSPTGETTELTFTDAAGTSGVGQPETSFKDRAGINRTSHQESPLLGASRELSFGPLAAAAAADEAAAAGDGVPAFGAAPDMGSCVKHGGAAGAMPPPAGLPQGLASSTPGGANYSPVPVSPALYSGSPAGSQAATAGGGDATPSSSGPASVPATGGDGGATRWQPSRLRNTAVATDALEGQGAAEQPQDRGSAEAGLPDGLDSSALPQRQCGRRRRRSQAGNAAAPAAAPAAAAQQANPAAPAPTLRVPASLAAAAAVPLPVEEAAKGGALAEAQQDLPSHAAASLAQDVSIGSADGAQDAKPAEAAPPALVSAAAAAEALGSSGLHEDGQEAPIADSPAVKEEAAEGASHLQASLQASAAVCSRNRPGCHECHMTADVCSHPAMLCKTAGTLPCCKDPPRNAAVEVATKGAQPGQMAASGSQSPIISLQHLGAASWAAFGQHLGMPTAMALQTLLQILPPAQASGQRSF